jgi:hypothetical protein
MTDRSKGIVASIWAGLVVVLVLTFLIYRDVQALRQDTQARAAAAQQRWAESRTQDQRRVQAGQDEILRQVMQLTVELRAQRLRIERLNSVTPVEAIKDRAVEGKRSKR